MIWLVPYDCPGEKPYVVRRYNTDRDVNTRGLWLS